MSVVLPAEMGIKAEHYRAQSVEVTYLNLWYWTFNGTMQYVNASYHDQLSEYTAWEDLVWCVRQFGLVDVLLIVVVAVALTATRIFCTTTCFTPLATAWRTPAHLRHKIPENLWKLAFYVLTTALSVTIVLVRRPQWFSDPFTIWENHQYRQETPIESDLYAAYMVQIGFYAHSLYATNCLDAPRKDHLAMNIHHVVTLWLLTFSHATRNHAAGMLCLLCHDINDIFLELWKLNSNLRHRDGGRHYKFHDVAANACFGLFFSTWYIFRLYYFPMTVLRACFHDVFVVFTPEQLPIFWPIFAVMLIALLFLDLYWFGLMVIGLVRYLFVGDLAEVDDVREFETGEGILRLRDNRRKPATATSDADISTKTHQD